MYKDFRELWTEELWEWSFGRSSLTAYESSADLYDWQLWEKPYMVVWLHGMHQGPIDACTMRKLQRRLWRKVIFLVPTNPEPSHDGMHFSWGCTFTKNQNKKDLGYVNGDLCKPYLAALTAKVNDAADYFNAERVLVMGYSMGGFGALQLGAWAPETYDAVVSVAGYGMGTLEPTEKSGAPQPKGSKVFDWYLDKHVAKLADVPIVMGVHSRADGISAFGDVNAIIDKVSDAAYRSWKNCHARMVEVPTELANSDYSGKKRASAGGHGYFNVSLLKDRSEDFLWDELRHQLDRAEKRLRSRQGEGNGLQASWKREQSYESDPPSKRWRWR